VQRCATKFVWGMENLHYDDKLIQLGLMHPDRRRVRNDLTEVLKIINGYYDITLGWNTF